jgi:lipoyl(octanoyl) transferase
MDMSPWSRINPCGLGVKMTQLADLVEPSPSKQQVIDKLAELLQLALGYNSYLLGSESILAEYKSKEI